MNEIFVNNLADVPDQIDLNGVFKYSECQVFYF